MRVAVYVIIALSVLIGGTVRSVEARTALHDYVLQSQDAYEWYAHSRQTIDNITWYELELVSQRWQETTWRHRLNILLPENCASAKTALLFITGSGSGRDEIQYLAPVAQRLQVPVAILHDVPNQPILGGLREDAAIAQTFMMFLESGDSTVPLLIPMVKSAVQAMDAVSAFWQQYANGQELSFVVSGASKRGWTTWLTAAVDSRVQAIAPIVYDNLDLPTQMEHQLAVWGAYSPQIRDYTQFDLQAQLDTPQGRALVEIVDPFAYRDKISVPKMIIQGTNDPYWPVDALNLYYSELKGPTSIVYVPNEGHGLEDITRAQLGIAALMEGLRQNQPLPEFTWQYHMDSNGLTLRTTANRAERIRYWVADSAVRDFRDAEWRVVHEHNRTKQTNQAEGGLTSATAVLQLPDTGYRAVFAEADFDFHGIPLSLSTQIKVLP